MIILTGLPGTGKSTLGRLLSEKLQCQFFDIDDHFPEDFRKRVSKGDIIKGEEWKDYLLEIANVLKKLEKKGLVVAVVMLIKKEYVTMYNKILPYAKIIELQAPVALLKDRLRKRKDHFFNGKDFDTLLTEVENFSGTTIDASGSVEENLHRLLKIVS